MNSSLSKFLTMASIRFLALGTQNKYHFFHGTFLFIGKYHNAHLPPVFYYLGSAMAFSITCIQIHIRYSNYKGKKHA